MTTTTREPDIPGTTLFDGTLARKGYALNKMCYSFNQAANRDAFVRDEAAYCAQYGLTDEQLDGHVHCDAKLRVPRALDRARRRTDAPTC